MSAHTLPKDKVTYNYEHAVAGGVMNEIMLNSLARVAPKLNSIEVSQADRLAKGCVSNENLEFQERSLCSDFFKSGHRSPPSFHASSLP